MTDKTPSPRVVIDLLSSDDEDDRKPAAVSHKKRGSDLQTSGLPNTATATVTPGGTALKRIKTEPTVPQEEDSDVEIIESPYAAGPKTHTSIAASMTNDPEIQVVGTKNQLDLPHMRQHCTVRPFAEDPKLFCDLCYCYVCDVPASACDSWSHSHCRATDTGARAYQWKRMREQKKRPGTSTNLFGNTSTTAQANTQQTEPIPDGAFESAQFLMEPPEDFHYEYECDDNESGYDSDPYFYGFERQGPCEYCYCYVCHLPKDQCTDNSSWYSPTGHSRAVPNVLWMIRRYNSVKDRVVGTPPYAADHPNVTTARHLVQCLNCTWYSPIDGHICRKCGIYLPEKIYPDTGKSSYVSASHQTPLPNPNDLKDCVSLGQRELVFDVRVHDPRKLFEAAWQENSDWNLDEAAMKRAFFQHFIGERPTVEAIHRATCVFTEEAMDKEQISICDIFENRSHLSESLGIVFQDPNDFALVKILGHLLAQCSYWPIFYHLSAAWNQETCKGVLSVSVHGRTVVNRRVADKESAAFVYLWFNGESLRLDSLVSSGFPMKKLNSLHSRGNDYGLYRSTLQNPMTTETNGKKVKEAATLLVDEKVDSIKNASQLRESMLSLSNSSGFKWGGTNAMQTDFYSVMKEILCVSFRYGFSEHTHGHYLNPLIDHKLGKTWWSRVYSRTRPMDPDTYHQSDPCKRWSDGIFHPEDFSAHFSLTFDNDNSYLRSVKNFMQNLEDLGHESEESIDGLSVDLLPFQKQSLKWALERERVPGGILRLFWTKLPSMNGMKRDIYYNPFLQVFKTSKPILRRGGIVAEEMGLGKTVITLALILCNPAPAFPISGSSVSLIQQPTEESTAFWDPDLYNRESVLLESPKRGSILSRATLVVCNVSLVGQWIDEARSKLDDPGIVYSYHGAGRKRDPVVLSKHSIVVTTYETLASDFTYHRNNSSDKSYCPPCERIRWWRIICDECHVLRNANSLKSKAVMALSADHKWLVSGTPINTSIKDLSNQFEFLGLQDEARCLDHFFDFGSGRSRALNFREFKSDNPGFLFLRKIMIRHSQQQKYRGTNTTLMSLPPKTERDVIVDFSPEDLAEYAKMEAECQCQYDLVKQEHSGQLQRHFFLLSQMLVPIRAACSGGNPPLRGEVTADDLEDEGETGEKQKTTEVKYSDHCFTSKFKELLRELIRIRDEDPSSKSLVFSQFKSTLEWLKVELPKHGFQFRSLSGDMTLAKRAKALREFQSDPPTTIFLLSMRAGAVGINLTQANRIFIMEPHFNPAIEAQAIGRVHRMGQKRPVEITRFIMKNSVEARMRTMLKNKYGGSKQDDEKSHKEESKDIDVAKTSPEGNGNAQEDLDRKPAAIPSTHEQREVLVGNLTRDKAVIAEEEFDLLFGVSKEE